MQKVINIKRLSHTRNKLLPCLNVLFHCAQNNSSSTHKTVEKMNSSDINLTDRHVVFDLDAAGVVLRVSDSGGGCGGWAGA